MSLFLPRLQHFCRNFVFPLLLYPGLFRVRMCSRCSQLIMLWRSSSFTATSLFINLMLILSNVFILYCLLTISSVSYTCLSTQWHAFLPILVNYFSSYPFVCVASPNLPCNPAWSVFFFLSVILCFTIFLCGSISLSCSSFYTIRLSHQILSMFD